MLVQGNKRYCKSIWLSMILKVGPPPLLRLHDEQPDNPDLIDPIKTMQRSYFEALSKKITALAFEYIKMKTATRCTIVSEIAGTASILIAAELMITNEFGKGCYLVT
jgi:alanine dehydrogenase